METGINDNGTRKLNEEDLKVRNEGYMAQASGKDMSLNNPYHSTDERHWTWRRGFIEAHVDSDGGVRREGYGVIFGGSLLH